MLEDAFITQEKPPEKLFISHRKNFLSLLCAKADHYD
jgi:hypothetical protein